MKKLVKLLLLLIILFPNHVFARPIIADVNPRKIDIDQNFKGLDLLVYGAQNDAGNIVVVIRGPQERQILRKKGRVFGVWTNVENIELKNLYSYYAMASMKPLTSVQNDVLLKNLEIGEENINIVGEDYLGMKRSDEIKDSVIKLMQSKNLYSDNNYKVSFWGETLFRTFMNFPKNITKGIYSLDIYLFNDGNLHSFQTMPIIVDKVGMEAFIADMAVKRPFEYGMISVLMAITIGLLVGVLFSRR